MVITICGTKEQYFIVVHYAEVGTFLKSVFLHIVGFHSSALCLKINVESKTEKPPRKNVFQISLFLRAITLTVIRIRCCVAHNKFLVGSN